MDLMDRRGKGSIVRIVWWLCGLSFLAVAGWLVISRTGGAAGKGKADVLVVPVEVASIRREAIELRRTFTGTLEAPARFVVSSKVGGRIERLSVDLADSVENGQVVVELDDQEYQQAVVQASADLAVARANLVEARSNLVIAERELNRVASLQTRGIASDAQADVAKAQHLTRQAAVEVAVAQVTRAEAALAGAKIRLGYTSVTANWTGTGHRYVSERFVNEGGTVVANTPLLSIVELDPIIAVVFVAERDYGLLRVGQSAGISTDAFPGETFAGSVARVSPVFNESSRQARVELAISNGDQKLKPGMFVHAEVLLERAPEATIVPFSALVTRGGQTGVFVVNGAGDSVSWQTVVPGIRQDDRVQVTEPELAGRVVTMGQQLIDDGSPVTIAEPDLEKGRSTE